MRTLAFCLAISGFFAWIGGAAAADTPEKLAIEATFAVPGAQMAFGFDSLWIMSDGRMVRIDARDNSTARIAVPNGENALMLMELDRYRGIAVGEGAVWVPDMASSTIFKIDPELNKVVMTIATDIFGARGSIGVGEGSVWVLTFATHNKTLARYSAASGVIEAEIPLPEAGAAVLVAHGSVWVTAASAGELYRVDPAANQVASTIPIHAAAAALAADDASVWIPFDVDGTVQRVDPASGQVAATIAAGTSDMEQDGDIATGAGFVWTINRGSIVARIHAASNDARGTFRPPEGASSGRRIRFGDNSLWLSGNAVVRVKLPD